MVRKEEQAMDDTSDTCTGRRQFLQATGAAIVATATAALGTTGEAATAATEQIPFKATVVTPVAQVTQFSIPVTPPLVSEAFSVAGKAEPLGTVTYTDHHMAQIGVDGIPKSITDGIGVFAAANGDALFSNWSGLLRPAATGFTLEAAFTITGGSGPYCGATGSGVLNGVIDGVKGEVTFSWDGMLLLPGK